MCVSPLRASDLCQTSVWTADFADQSLGVVLVRMRSMPVAYRGNRVAFNTSMNISLVGWFVLLFLKIVLAAGANPGYKLIVPPDIKPIQLVRKPEHAQGQLEITDEGMSVLLNLTSPFAMVSAVGPTRCVQNSCIRLFTDGSTRDCCIGRRTCSICTLEAGGCCPCGLHGVSCVCDDFSCLVCVKTTRSPSL